MGLENFNIAADNKGGRKPGSGEEKPDPTIIETAYTRKKDSEDWWQQVWDDYVSYDEPTRGEMMRICNDLHVLPRTVKQKFTEYGLFEYEEFMRENTGKTKDKNSILGRLSGGDSSDEESDTNKDSSPLLSLTDERS